MNALVNDQLGRLRLLLGDPRVTRSSMHGPGAQPASRATPAARSTPASALPEKDQPRLKSIERFYITARSTGGQGPARRGTSAPRQLIEKLQERGKWPAKPDLKAWYGRRAAAGRTKTGEFIRAVMQPDDPELLTRARSAGRAADVLITNYSMLEYMLMRPLERPVFDATRQWLAGQPGREVPPRRRRGAPLPRRRRRRGRAAAAPAARHDSASRRAPPGHLHQRQLRQHRVRPGVRRPADRQGRRRLRDAVTWRARSSRVRDAAGVGSRRRRTRRGAAGGSTTAEDDAAAT